MPSGSDATAGPPIAPIDRLKLYDGGQWERFVLEWADSLRSRYESVEQHGGAGDLGCDVVAYLRDADGAWDNYQCKHYDHRLAPSDVWAEIGKLVVHTRRGALSVPEAYVFVAPQGAGTKLAKLLRQPDALQSLLTLAVTEERIPVNPVALIEKPSALPDGGLDPIPPATVEAMRRLAIGRRGPLGTQDAFIIAALAYAGLRPQELLALMDDDVLFDVAKLFVARKNVGGQLFPYLKSGRKRRSRRHRRVDLLDPLAQDFREHSMRTGRRGGLIIARADGTPWRKHDWDNWRERVWQPLAVDVGLGRYVKRKDKPPLYQGPPPYDLRGSFVSLLVWEGRTMLEVAAQAGHGVDVCELYYARIFEGFDPAKRTSASEAIRAARQGKGPKKDLIRADRGDHDA